MTAETAVTTARVRGKGQLTLPAEVREALRVSEGDEVESPVMRTARSLSGA